MKLGLRERFHNFLDCNWVQIWNTAHQIKRRMGLQSPPIDVQWLTTAGCNLRCAHCGTNAGERTQEELTTAEIKTVIDDLAILGTRLLQLTGGEPLTRKDLWEVLAYAAEKGIEYSLVTNGSFVMRQAEALRQLPPQAVKVSVDGLRDTHNQLRGADNFEDCMQALSFFEEIGVGTRVLCTTLNQRNFPELDDMLSMVRASEANFWEFHLAVREGRARDNQAWMYLEREQLVSLFRFVLLNRKVFPLFLGEGCGYLGAYTGSLYDGRRFFCGSGWNTFTIMPDGKVAGCPAFQDDWIEGNVREHAVTWLWENRFQRFRDQAELPDDCRNCGYLPACGGGCWMMRRSGDHCYKDIWERTDLLLPEPMEA